MSQIHLPYHLLVPAIIALVVFVVLLMNLKKLASGKRKWLWRSLTVFLVVYLFIVGRAAYNDITYNLALQKFDIDGDGIFSGNEVTPAQQRAMQKVVSVTGRNFSVISGLYFSGAAALLVFIFGKVADYFKLKRQSFG